MTPRERLKGIKIARARLSMLEARHNAALRVELSVLPSLYGFSTVTAFIKAVRAAVQGTGCDEMPKRKKRPIERVKITGAVRATVKYMAENGKTGLSIARATGISPQSVYHIKKLFGLVRARA